MIERKQQSASKRERIVREQEERRKRHEEGYISPDENDLPQNKKFLGSKLLLQQLAYDNEMEDQTTVNHEPMTMGELGFKNQVSANYRYAHGSQVQLSSELRPAV